MELTRLRDNILMNLKGDNIVRVAILLNEQEVLEFYSGKNGFVVGAITPIDDYVREEFGNYGYELNIVNHVLTNHTEILKSNVKLETVNTEEYRATVLLNGKYVVRLENDRVYITL